MPWQTRPTRQIPSPSPSPQTELRRRGIAPFVTGFPTRYGGARGAYRVFNDAAFRFYRGHTPPAEGDSPYATSATLPATPASTFADGTWYLSMSYFNGVLDSGFLPVGRQGETYVKLVVFGGAEVDIPPTAPLLPRLELRAGGIVRVLAQYVPAPDSAGRATSWGIAYTTNGSTPTTPSVSVAMSGTDSLQVLSYDLPAQSHGTTVKVIVYTSNVFGSGASAVLVATADALGPDAPVSLAAWPGSIED